ncbi:MAG: signal peptidase II [Bacteriovoracaceae bacterium]|nr:signal peptidase II [Bacteriovoracaceae bacterium]
MRKLFWMSLLFVIIVVLDQVTKVAITNNFMVRDSVTVIDGLFNITYVRNPGAAWGFMATASKTVRAVLFLFIPVVACFGFVYLIWRTRKDSVLLTLTYTLILAGAVGNLIDRFRLGYVIDFFDFHLMGKHFPAFNVADSSITIAAFLLIYDFFMQLKKAPEKLPGSK